MQITGVGFPRIVVEDVRILSWVDADADAADATPGAQRLNRRQLSEGGRGRLQFGERYITSTRRGGREWCQRGRRHTSVYAVHRRRHG